MRTNKQRILIFIVKIKNIHDKQTGHTKQRNRDTRYCITELLNILIIYIYTTTMNGYS